MRHLLFFSILLFAFAACTAPKQTAQVSIGNELQSTDDSTEYELIILDPGFDTWYVMHAKPEWYHSQSYLEMWNRQYVTAWNSKAMSSRGWRFFETYIDYQAHVDYGLELNHKLFYYFQYVERKLRIPILPAGMGPQSW